MAGEGGSDSLQGATAPENGIQVAVRVRPLNSRERTEGHRTCVSFDEPSKQVVLTAVDKNTLLQLRGSTAKGYAFDKRFDSDSVSSEIYESCIKQLVECCFRGYNATVLAYGQTGSGKTHTMSGGVGINDREEEGITPAVIRQIFELVKLIQLKEKAGEKTVVSAYGLELYNEELRDLSHAGSGRRDAGTGWDAGQPASGGLKLQERPVGKEGRVVPEVAGVHERVVGNAAELRKFYDECFANRSTTATKMNDHSSRSHAIFTITITRTVVEVLNELSDEFKAKVRTSDYAAKLHLVDLAGSERVKRSGVTGQALKEATHINSGLLALGNVIVALANEGEGKKKGHVPYRDSKLTRLLQDSLGGNSLTTLISCISPSEADFEETNNTLKYSNRACSIKNTPLPNKFTTLEEDLLPMLPSGAGPGMGMLQLQALLQDHERIKEQRERREKDRKDKDALRLAELQALTEAAVKKPGFQRLRANQYDELRRQLASRGTNIPSAQMVGDDTLRGFGKLRLTQSVDGPLVQTPGVPTPGSSARPRNFRTGSGRMGAGQESPADPGSPRGTPRARRPAARRPKKPAGFADWLATQESGATEGTEAAAEAEDGEELGTEDFLEEEGEGDFFEQDGDGNDSGAFIVEDDDTATSAAAAEAEFIVDDEPTTASSNDTPAAPIAAAKSKFRRGPASQIPSAPSADAATTPSNNTVDAGTAAAANDDNGDVGPVTAAENGGSSAQLDESLAVDESSAGDESAGVAAAQAEVQQAEEGGDDEEEPYDPIDDDEIPVLLARFKVNQHDTLSVFKACTKEDFQDVIGLLPENTPLPASNKMTYLLARLEIHPRCDIPAALAKVASGEASMNDAVGPAVGCLMATFGTNMIASCIFDFEDPADLKFYTVEERIELWGLQIPHNSARPSLPETSSASDSAGGGGGSSGDATGGTLQPSSGSGSSRPGTAAGGGGGGLASPETITWSSVDRLNMSIGLLYSLCNHAQDNNIRCGFCVPRPQLLKRWMQAGVRMEQIRSPLKLIYPPSAHDYEYYRASTVAWFMVADVRAKLETVLGIVGE